MAYRDTLGDVALGLLGGTIAAIVTAWWPRREPPAGEIAPAG